MYFLIETGPAGRLIAALGTGAAGRLIAGAASRSIPKTLKHWVGVQRG